MGLTVTEPVAPNVPTPPMVTEVVLLAVQFNLVLEPLLIIVDCAVKTIAGADCPEPLDDCEPEPHPIAAIKTENRNTTDPNRKANVIETPKR